MKSGWAQVDRSLLVIAAGVTAAIHVAKLPPALPALRDSLGIGLVQGGFLISLVQMAGMSLGLVVGLAADGLGLRRTLLMGLGLLSVASFAGGFATTASALLMLRALEGLGFLLAVMPGPGLIRRHVRDTALAMRLGLWGTYMPVGTALALLIGPVWIAHWRWTTWWGLAAALSALMTAVVLLALPADPRRGAATPTANQGAGHSAWRQRLLQTLRSRGPWLVAVAFAVYSTQWIAVIGFLPSIYAQAGLAPVIAGVATALAAGVNMLGNIAAGRCLSRGVAPERLLQAGFGTMAMAGVLAFAPLWPAVPWIAALGPYLAVLAFSSVGGLVPGTLFSLSVRLAPHPQAVSTTVGWMQQWSALGQFAGPPVLAWVATRSGNWSWSWVFTLACALVGLWLARVIGAERRRLCAVAA